MNRFNALLFALRCYCAARAGGARVVAASSYGVPVYIGFIASGREAWRASDLAIDYFARRGLTAKGLE